MDADRTRTDAAPRTAGRLVAGVVLGAVAVLFLVAGWSRITAGFGDSDEGINGAVWGYGARSLREAGPVESRLGGLRLDGTAYANHPPLVVVETALAETIAGERPAATRAAAWLGALATIPLLFLLLRRIGVDRVVAATATAAGLSCHLFLTYGLMLDTMVVAFPLALGLLAVWVPTWRGPTGSEPDGRRPWPALAAVGALAFATSIAGWQATFLTALCGLALAGGARRDRRRLVEAVPYLAGAALAVVATVAWARWSYGSLDPLLDKFLRRSGEGTAVGLGDMVRFQLPWLRDLLGLGLLAAVGSLVALRDDRFRAPVAVALSSVVLYALLFREGSGGHQYWNYWALLPAALGFAYAFDRAGHAMRGRGTSADAVAAVLVGAVVIVGAVNLTRPDKAGAAIDEGLVPLALVTDTPLASGQTELPTVSEPRRAEDWLIYAGIRPGPTLDADTLAALAAARPDDLVLVLGSCDDPDPTGLCDALTGGGDAPPRLVPAEALLAEWEAMR